MRQRATRIRPTGLRRHRILAGVRLYDLRRLTGISESTLGRIERGERNASSNELELIARALRIPKGEIGSATRNGTHGVPSDAGPPDALNLVRASTVTENNADD